MTQLWAWPLGVQAQPNGSALRYDQWLYYHWQIVLHGRLPA